MTLFLWLAAAMSLVTALAHLLVGGRYLVRPLLAVRELHDVPRYTHYFCWHIVSAVLLMMAGVFAAVALERLSTDCAVLMTALSGSCLVWNVGLIAWKRQSPLLMPQWMLFGPLTLFAVLGLGL